MKRIDITLLLLVLLLAGAVMYRRLARPQCRYHASTVVKDPELVARLPPETPIPEALMVPLGGIGRVMSVVYGNEVVFGRTDLQPIRELQQIVRRVFNRDMPEKERENFIWAMRQIVMWRVRTGSGYPPAEMENSIQQWRMTEKLLAQENESLKDVFCLDSLY